jgi:hypothetical protein
MLAEIRFNLLSKARHRSTNLNKKAFNHSIKGFLFYLWEQKILLFNQYFFL